MKHLCKLKPEIPDLKKNMVELKNKCLFSNLNVFCCCLVLKQLASGEKKKKSISTTVRTKVPTLVERKQDASRERWPCLLFTATPWLANKTFQPYNKWITTCDCTTDTHWIGRTPPLLREILFKTKNPTNRMVVTAHFQVQ